MRFQVVGMFMLACIVAAFSLFVLPEWLGTSTSEAVAFVALVVAILATSSAVYTAKKAHATAEIALYTSKAPQEPYLMPRMCMYGKDKFEFSIINVGGGIAEYLTLEVSGGLIHDDLDMIVLMPNESTRPITVRHENGELEHMRAVSVSVACQNMFGDTRGTSMNFYVEPDPSGNGYRINKVTSSLVNYIVQKVPYYITPEGVSVMGS